jgi:hypothetical protein
MVGARVGGSLAKARMKQMTDEERVGWRGGGREHHGPWVWTAYRAYNELLRDKIKQRFEKKEGPWMDKLADVLVDLVDARWEGGRAGSKRESEIMERLSKLLEE